MPRADDRAEELLDAIGELYAVILRISRRIEEREAMTSTQRLALIEVAVGGPLRLCDLASRMDTTPATASRAIDALEEFRLVARCPDPSDGRAVLLRATARGRRWAEERRALLLESLRDVPPDTLPDTLTDDICRLKAALREATGHNEVARGVLLAR